MPTIGTVQLEVQPNVLLVGGIQSDSAPLLSQHHVVFVELRQNDEEFVYLDHQALSAHRVRIVRMPMGRQAPKPEQVASLNEILEENRDRLIVLHCSSGNRAGLLWASLLRQRGWSFEDALGAVSPLVTREPIVEAVRQYNVEETSD